jgi:hypothetical protein
MALVVKAVEVAPVREVQVILHWEGWNQSEETKLPQGISTPDSISSIEGA